MSRTTLRTHRLGIQPSWSGLAVVVEALVLLLALVASLTVLTQLFAAASVRAHDGEQLAAAVSCATNAAERFAADPAHADGVTHQDGLTVACTVSAEDTARGTLYHATIVVSSPRSDEPVYTLATTRYEQEVG